MILKNLTGEVSEGTFLQVDYFRWGSNAVLDEAYTDKLLNAIDLLNSITPRHCQCDLENFIKRFKQCYHEQEIPLIQAIDQENGVGYGHNSREKLNPANSGVSEYNNIINRLISHVLNNPDLEVVNIPEAMVSPVVINDEHNLPSGFSVTFRISNDDTPVIYLEHCGKPTGTAMFNRLANVEKSFNQIVKEINESEAHRYSPALQAEIIHAPVDSLGDLDSGAFPGIHASVTGAEGNELPVVHTRDLMVAVRDNEVILRSISLNRRIIPATTHAANYGSDTLPVYRFLNDVMQRETNQQLGINLDILPELGITKAPRIVYEDVILALKTWYIKSDDMAKLRHAITIDYEAAWSRFLNYHELPSIFAYNDEGNEFVVHSNNRLEVIAWLSCCKTQQHVVLKEYIGESNNIILKRKDEQANANQFVAVLKRGERTPAGTYGGTTPMNVDIAKKQFFPGDEWLYVKLYCGLKAADNIIGNELIQLSKKLYHENLVDQWFYVRHADPEPHIRFNVHLTSVFALGRVIQSINTAFSAVIKSKKIWKVQFDTYERELELYGEASIELVEQLFFNDSLAIASLLSRMNVTANFDEARWLWGLLSIDRLLNDFELDIAQKTAIVRQLAQSSHPDEHDGSDNLLNRQLSFRYRHYRNRIEALFAVGGDVVGEDLLRFRSLNNRPATRLLTGLINGGSKSRNLAQLLINLIEMSINRLFKTKQDVHEVFVYDFLLLYYNSTRQQNTSGHINYTVNAKSQYRPDGPCRH